MPDSWLYSDQGRACTARYAQMYGGQDRAHTARFKTSTYEPECVQEKDGFGDDTRLWIGRVPSTEDIITESNQGTTPHQERSTTRKMFTNSGRKPSLQERIRWIIERRRWRLWSLRPSRRHCSFLNGLSKRSAQDKYEWNLQLSDSPGYRPVSLILGADAEGQDLDQLDPQAQSSLEIQKVRVVEKTLNDARNKENGTSKGLERLENLEKVMFLQEIHELRKRSRRSMMEPITEEKDLAFSNGTYEGMLVQPDYENCTAEELRARSEDMNLVPDYENVETSTGRILKSTGRILKSTAIYENQPLSPKAKNLQNILTRTSGREEIYENYNFGEDTVYQNIRFGKQSSYPSSSPEDSTATEARIREFVQSIEQVNKLIETPEKMLENATVPKSTTRVSDKSNIFARTPGVPKFTTRVSDRSKTSASRHEQFNPKEATETITSPKSEERQLQFVSRRNIFGNYIKKKGGQCTGDTAGVKAGLLYTPEDQKTGLLYTPEDQKTGLMYTPEDQKTGLQYTPEVQKTGLQYTPEDQKTGLQYTPEDQKTGLLFTPEEQRIVAEFLAKCRSDLRVRTVTGVGQGQARPNNNKCDESLAARN